MNTYILKVGGKTIVRKACNLKTAIENEGYVIKTMLQDNPRRLNGKGHVYCEGSCYIETFWVEKLKKLGTFNEIAEDIKNHHREESEQNDYWESRKRVNELSAMDNKPYDNGVHGSY